MHVKKIPKINKKMKTTYPVTRKARVTGWPSSFIFLGHRRRTRIIWPPPPTGGEEAEGNTSEEICFFNFSPDHGILHLLFFFPYRNWGKLHYMWGSWLYSQQGLEDDTLWKFSLILLFYKCPHLVLLSNFRFYIHFFQHQYLPISPYFCLFILSDFQYFSSIQSIVILAFTFSGIVISFEIIISAVWCT